jgi:mercuric ion transport protein
MDALKKNVFVSFFSLFTSMSTLVCCALPAFLVSVGLGATMVGLVTTFPGLIWLSEHKYLIFGLSAGMLAISSYMQYRARFLPCPLDPDAALACNRARKWSEFITLFSIVVWVIGFTFAMIPLIIQKFDS